METSMFRPDLLKGKTIIITGGGTGLGKAMAARFGGLGANLIITSRTQEVLDQSAQEIEAETGSDILPIACDIRRTANVKDMVSQAVERFGNIDVLVNNAAGNFISPTEDLSEGGFKVIVDIVLNGTFNCTQAVGRSMIKKKKSGCILNIVTTYAWTGSGYVVPSAAAKAGVLAMTRSLAVEWAKYGIRTNAIAPGPFPTKGAWDRLVPAGFGIERRMRKRIPLNRFGEHRELADLAAFLVSDGAGFINGEVVTIDGGEWLKGAGEFNDLDRLPRTAWKTIGSLVRRKRNKK
jgi:NAD(P)-dependent dehydrogenase (short-subunit alcohol dehydrogenase family)